VKIIKQDKKGNQVTIEIEESYSKIEPHMKKAYVEASQSVTIPGFRPGKVPADVMKKYINDEAVIDRAVQHLISEIYPTVIDETKIEPVDYPNVEVKKLDKGSNILFELKVDVYPSIKLGSYKGLIIKKRETEVTDDDVTKTLEVIKKGYAKQNELDENKLALDDEFAKKVSTAATIDALRAMIRSNIELEKKEDVEGARRDEITAKLAEIVEAEVPNAMIDHEIETMLGDLDIQLKRSRMTLDSYLSAVKKSMEQLKEDLKKNALTRVKAKLGLEEILKKEKLEVDEADLDKEIEAIAAQSGKDIEEYKAELSAEVKKSIKDFMLREKVIQMLIEKAKEE
jgi:trigger factor